MNYGVYVTRKQFPICLAYAITIHKSQGLTLESCVIDVGDNISSNGQTYVALSAVHCKFKSIGKEDLEFKVIGLLLCRTFLILKISVVQFGVYEDFCCGTVYKSKEIFKNALTIQLQRES